MIETLTLMQKLEKEENLIITVNIYFDLGKIATHTFFIPVYE